jgi:ATP-dependent Clp protease ATP-binding subunit ClpB
MRWDKFTVKAQDAISEAQKKAEASGHQMIENEHVLYALLQERDGTVESILEKLGSNPSVVKNDLEKELGRLPKVEGAGQQAFIGPTLKGTIDIAFAEAERLKDEYVSTEHVLIGMADVHEGAASKILQSHGVTKDRIYAILKDIRGTQRVTDQNPEEKYQALQRYCRDLTEEARKGKLDPVIGRDDQKQPCGDRGGRCGKDGHRRRACPEDSEWRHTGDFEKQAGPRPGPRCASGGGKVSGRVRG